MKYYKEILRDTAEYKPEHKIIGCGHVSIQWPLSDKGHAFVGLEEMAPIIDDVLAITCLEDHHFCVCVEESRLVLVIEIPAEIAQADDDIIPSIPVE